MSPTECRRPPGDGGEVSGGLGGVGRGVVKSGGGEGVAMGTLTCTQSDAADEATEDGMEAVDDRDERLVVLETLSLRRWRASAMMHSSSRRLCMRE